MRKTILAATLILSTAIVIQAENLPSTRQPPAESQNSQKNETGFPFIGIINSEGINLRSGPNTTSESLSKLNKETKVKVVSERFDWYRVSLPNTVRCFINSRYIKDGVVIADKVNLRASAGQDSAILGQVDKGVNVEIIKTEPEWPATNTLSDWYAIAAPQDLAFGWVHKKFVDYYSEVITEPVKIETPVAEEIKEKIRPLACGIIRPMGIFFKRRGSHRLIVGGKTAYYLKSENKELLNSFTGYTVNIFGIITEIPGQKILLINVNKIEVVQ